jgi:hypothetical protein
MMMMSFLSVSIRSLLSPKSFVALFLSRLSQARPQKKKVSTKSRRCCRAIDRSPSPCCEKAVAAAARSGKRRKKRERERRNGTAAAPPISFLQASLSRPGTITLLPKQMQPVSASHWPCRQDQKPQEGDRWSERGYLPNKLLFSNKDDVLDKCPY